MGYIVLALQLQNKKLFKPITINFLHNIYLFYLNFDFLLSNANLFPLVWTYNLI